MDETTKREHSPLPWRLDDGFACEVLDRNGTHIFTCSTKYGHIGDEREAANAALILEAVNERWKLLGLVRELVDKLDDAWDFINRIGARSEDVCEELHRAMEKGRAAQEADG